MKRAAFPPPRIGRFESGQKMAEKPQEPTPSDEINALGGAIQASATIAGISVALYVSLYTFGPRPLQPVTTFIAGSAAVSLLASLAAVWMVTKKFHDRKDEDKRLLIPFLGLLGGILVLGIGFLFLVAPWTSHAVGRIFAWLAEFFK
jgi:hypothetical protein